MRREREREEYKESLKGSVGTCTRSVPGYSSCWCCLCYAATPAAAATTAATANACG